MLGKAGRGAAPCCGCACDGRGGAGWASWTLGGGAPAAGCCCACAGAPVCCCCCGCCCGCCSCGGAASCCCGVARAAGPALPPACCCCCCACGGPCGGMPPGAGCAPPGGCIVRAAVVVRSHWRAGPRQRSPAAALRSTHENDDVAFTPTLRTFALHAPDCVRRSLQSSLMPTTEARTAEKYSPTAFSQQDALPMLLCAARVAPRCLHRAGGFQSKPPQREHARTSPPLAKRGPELLPPLLELLVVRRAVVVVQAGVVRAEQHLAHLGRVLRRHLQAQRAQCDDGTRWT